MSATTWKTPRFETNDLGYIRVADQILSVLWAQYNQYEPKWFYRNFSINWDIYSIWNFGADNLSKGFEWNANMNLRNFWNVNAGGAIRGNNLDQTILRGGPMMKTPGNVSGRIGFTSDNRKKLVLNASVSYTGGFEKCSKDFGSSAGISFKPTNWLVVSFNPGFSRSFSELQYVTSLNVKNEEKFIFAGIDRKTVSTSFRVNLNLSPDLTVQYWGQPFFATGKYYNHKLITDPMAARYRDRFRTYSGNQIATDGNNYNIDENADGSPDYSFGRRDFNIQDFLSNLVIRWEYSPGSSVYFVWSQTRQSSDSSDMDILNDMGKLFSTSDNKPHNVFLIKFSYRFGLK